jgi:glycosyltransferase involved in cell wall biosynthesis
VLRPFFRWWFTRRLRSQCAGACAAAYVTERALQRRYPPGPDAFATSYSDVELGENSFAAVPRMPAPSSPTRLLFVGTLAQLYKAPDVLLEAFAFCAHEGLDVRLCLVGDGKHRPELEKRAAALGVSERVEFRGQLASGELVRRELDRADLFVLPSRQEGLPRAMIEAMARGLPCIGSTVGGIPELLPGSDLVPPNDARRLARTIRNVVTDHARMARMSARNLEKAREYAPERLARRRGHFYEHVRIRTQEWLKAKAGER